LLENSAAWTQRIIQELRSQLVCIIDSTSTSCCNPRSRPNRLGRGSRPMAVLPGPPRCACRYLRASPRPQWTRAGRAFDSSPQAARCSSRTLPCAPNGSGRSSSRRMSLPPQRSHTSAALGGLVVSGTRPAPTTSATARKARHDLVDGQVVAEHGIELHAQVLQHAGQGLGLLHRARKAIEQEPARAAQAVRPLAHDSNDRLVGNQRTRFM